LKNHFYSSVLSFITIFLIVIQTKCIGNDSLYTIPFKLYDDIVVIKVQINGSDSLNFIFDSGTTTSLIDSITAVHLGIVSNENEGLLMSNEYEEVPLSKFKTLKAGNVTIFNRPVIIQHSFENYTRIMGIPMNGIIGMDFFGKYVMEIDFDKQQITLANAIDTTGFYSIKAKIHNDLFYVNASIFTNAHDSIPHLFLFDTGDLTSISLAEPFWKNNDLLSKCSSFYSGINRSSSGTSTASYFGRFYQIAFYPFHFKDAYINLTSAKRGFFSNDSVAGTLGIDILKRFSIIFNLKDEIIYIKPNSQFYNSYRTNTTGLRTRLNKELTQCVIEAILPHSPAETANLQVGDIIVSINGVEASKETISKMRQLTRSVPETILHCNVLRASEILEKELICKEFSDK
jgi:hypothetical protein